MTTHQQGRRKRRTSLWFAMAIIGLLVVLIVVPPMISIGRYKKRITEAVSASLHRPVRMSSVELRMLPRPGFVLTDLTVAEDPAYGAEPVLHANTVTTAIRLTSLWRGQLQLSRISVDEASLNLVHMPDGRWNIDALFHTANTLPGPSNAHPIPVPYMEATNSRLNIKNGDEKLPFSLLNTDASLWQESGVWHVRLRGQPARTDISLDLADTGIVRAEAAVHPAAQLSQMPLHLDLDWRSAQLGQLTRLLLGSDEGWRGDLTGEFHLDGTVGSTKVKSRLRASGVHREEFAPAAPIDFDATCGFQYLSTERSIDGLLCDSPIGDGRARLTGNFPAGQAPRFTLELDRAPAQMGLDVLRTVRSNIAPGLQAAGTISGGMTYDPSLPEQPRAQVHTRRPANSTAESNITQEEATPLVGSFLVEGLSLSGGALSKPIQVAKMTLAPASPSPDSRAALATAVQIPAGESVSLDVAARITLSGFQINVRGPATLPRLREFLHVAGIPQAEDLHQISGQSASLDLASAGPWLTLPSVPSTPGIRTPAPLIPLNGGGGSGSLTGSISFHDAKWQSSFLANPVLLSAATLHFEHGALRWDPVDFSYGPLKGSASMEVPPPCEGPLTCLPRLAVRFDTLDAAVLQAALLGAPDKATVLSTLLSRLKPDSASTWPQLEGTLSATNAVVGPFSLQNLSASVRVGPNGAQLSSFDAQFLGGSVHGRGIFTPGDKPSYKLDAALEQLHPGPVAQLVGLKGSGSPIGATGTLELTGYTAEDLSLSAKGMLRYEWPHGSLSGSGVPAALNRFDLWTGQAKIAQGALELRPNEIKKSRQEISVPVRISFGMPAKVAFPAH